MLHRLVLSKELCARTPNSYIRKLCTVHCWRNVNKPSAPTEVNGKGLKLWYDITVQKNKLIYQVRASTYDFWLSGQYGKYNINRFLFHPLSPFSWKMMLCPWILCFDLLHFSTHDLTHEIWRLLGYIFLGPVHRARYSTNGDQKCWPASEIQIFYVCSSFLLLQWSRLPFLSHKFSF